MLNTKTIEKYLKFPEAYVSVLNIDLDISESDLSAIEHKLDMCFNLTNSSFIHSEDRFYPNYYDVLYVFKWLEFIGPVVTFPIVTTVAFVLNLIIILIIKNKKNKKEKLFESKMFKFILLISVFNCIECLIYEFRLMGICLGVNSIFCSAIRSSKVVEYFGASVTGYLSEVMKTCLIITGLFFSIQRYIDTSKSKNRFANKFAELKVKRLGFTVVVISAITSISKFFEFDFEYVTYDSPAPFYIKAMNHSDTGYTRIVFYFLHYLLNDLVFLVINLIIDAFLVAKIKSNLKEKLKARSHTNQTQNLSEADVRKLEEEVKKKKSVEHKANQLIVSNIIIYVLCRLPELFGIFHFYFDFNPLSINKDCEGEILCYLIANSIEYLYMLAYLSNIIIYYKFNNNFQIGFRNFFGLARKEKKVRKNA